MNRYNGKVPYILYFSLCVIGLLGPGVNSEELSLTLWDKIYSRFYGARDIQFSLYVYLYSCIVFLGFVYLFQIKLSQILTERIYYLLIRYKSFYRWFWHLISQVLIGLVTLLCGLLLISLFIGWIQGYSPEPRITLVDGVSLTNLLYHFLINGFLQVLNYILVVFIVTWIFKESSFTLLAFGALLVIGLPAVNRYALLPSGLNSLAYVSSNDPGIYFITLLLTVYLLIELLIIHYLFKKNSVLF